MSTVPYFLDALDTAPGQWPETPCKERPDLFVDSSRTTPLKEQTEKARAYCARCPVREACADYAIANDFRDGIWGGLTVEERDRLARQQTDLA